MKNKSNKPIPKGLYVALLSFSFFVCFGGTALNAQENEGSIVNSPAYAWGDKIGWINFATDGGNVVVTDSGLSGYLWSKTYGWINLSPGGDFGGVTNDGNGNLGGYAWNSLLGHINFEGATIDDSGTFVGTVGDAGSTAGRITFDCDACDVQTDWQSGGQVGGEDDSEQSSPSSGGYSSNGSNNEYDILNNPESFNTQFEQDAGSDEFQSDENISSDFADDLNEDGQEIEFGLETGDSMSPASPWTLLPLLMVLPLLFWWWFRKVF